MAERTYLGQQGLDTLVEQILIKLNEKLSLTGGHVTGDTIIDTLQSANLSITGTATYTEEPDYDSNPMLLTTRQKVNTMLSDLDLNTIKITDGTVITVVQPSDLDNLKNSIEPILCQELPIPDSTNHGRLALVYDGTSDSVYVSVLTNEGYTWKDLFNSGSVVSVDPTLTSGTKVADITVDGNVSSLYAPQYKAGTNITIDEETNTISAKGGTTVTVTPALTSGTKVADITVDGINKVLYTPTVDSTVFVPRLSGGAAGFSFINDKIFVGDFTNNVNNAFTNVRKLVDASGNIMAGVLTGAKINGASFSCNADGSAAFMHKTYPDTATIKSPNTGARNNAVLRFYATKDGVNSVGKLQFAINTSTASTPTEAMYKDVAMVDDIPKFVTLTQEEYNLISNPDADTFYVIVE